MLKYLFCLLISIALVFAGVTCAEEEAEVGVVEVRIGLSYPLTGSYASMGLNFVRIWDMAIEDVNEARYTTADGNVIKLNYYVADDAFQSALAAANANKFIDTNKVQFMSACGTSSSLGAQPITEAAKIVLMASGTASSVLGADKPYTFVTGVTNENLPIFTKWVTDNFEIDKVSIVLSETAPSHIAAEMVERSMDYFGIEILHTEFVDPSATDFYPVIDLILPGNPDAIWFSQGAGYGPAIIKQLWERGYRGYLLAALGAPPGNIVESVGGAEPLSNVIFQTANINSPLYPPAMHDFVERYTERYGEAPIGAGFHYCIEPYIIAQAVAKAGGVDDLEEVVRVMETEVFDTPYGLVAFGAAALYGVNHALLEPAFVNRYDENGEVVTEQVFSPEEAMNFCEEVLEATSG